MTRAQLLAALVTGFMVAVRGPAAGALDLPAAGSSPGRTGIRSLSGSRAEHSGAGSEEEGGESKPVGFRDECSIKDFARLARRLCILPSTTRREHTRLLQRAFSSARKLAVEGNAQIECRGKGAPGDGAAGAGEGHSTVITDDDAAAADARLGEGRAPNEFEKSACDREATLNFTQCMVALGFVASAAGMDEIRPKTWGDNAVALPVTRLIRMGAQKRPVSSSERRRGRPAGVFLHDEPWNAACRREGCTKYATFASPNSAVPQFCKAHCPEGELVRAMRGRWCIHQEQASASNESIVRCTKQASFKLPGTKRALYCAVHRPAGYVTALRSCRYSEGCTRLPSFGMRNASVPEYCAEHRDPSRHIMLKRHRCAYWEGCDSQAVFGPAPPGWIAPKMLVSGAFNPAANSSAAGAHNTSSTLGSEQEMNAADRGRLEGKLSGEGNSVARTKLSVTRRTGVMKGALFCGRHRRPGHVNLQYYSLLLRRQDDARHARRSKLE